MKKALRPAMLATSALVLAGVPALATYIPVGNGVTTLLNTTGAPVVVELDANSRPLLVPASSFGSGSTASGTTLSSAVLDSTGTKLTLTFSQADTLTLADFSVSVAGAAASLTDADAATSGTTHVLTLATAATYQQAVTLSATPVAATSPALGAVISGATVTNNSTVGAPAATTLSSAVVASNGTALTLTFNQAVTLIASDFSVSVAGVADSLTDSDASTSQTTHVLTLASTAASGQAVTVSASPVGATTPPLGAVISGTAVTNNSTVVASTARALALNVSGNAIANSSIQTNTVTSNLTLTVKVSSGTSWSASSTYGLMLSCPYPWNYFLLVDSGSIPEVSLYGPGGIMGYKATAGIPSGATQLQVVANATAGTIVFQTAGTNGVYSQLGSTVSMSTGNINGETGTPYVGGVPGSVNTYAGNAVNDAPSGFKIAEASASVDGNTMFDLNLTADTAGATTVQDTAGRSWTITSPAAIQ